MRAVIESEASSISPSSFFLLRFFFRTFENACLD